MGMKKAILSLSIIAILTIYMFNGDAAAPVSKLTPDIQRWSDDWLCDF
jgi:hypothetical protein